MPAPFALPELLAAVPLAVEAGAAGAGASVQAGAPYAWSLVLAGAVVVASLFPLAAARSKADFTPADLAAEKARLAKEITGLANTAEQTRRKLDNPDFVARAPEEVVEENRERLAEAEAARERLQAALARLS